MEDIVKVEEVGMVGIYKITSPSLKIYIGQSVNIRKRWIQHKSSFNKYDNALSRSFKKYGFNNHQFEIIHVCKKEMLNTMEKHYVSKYDSFNSCLGLNSKDGGGSRGVASNETKLKLSISHMGKISPRKGKKSTSKIWCEGTVGVCVAWNKGLKGIYSKETLQKISESQTGRIVPEDRKIKISNSMKGRTFSDKHRENLKIAALNRYKHLKLIKNEQQQQ